MLHCLRGAFETIDRDIFSKLQTYRVRGRILQRVKEYLTNQKKKVKRLENLFK